MNYLETLSISQLLVLLLLLCLLVPIPAAIFINAWWSAREEEVEHRRGLRYAYKGVDEYGTPIYLELPKE